MFPALPWNHSQVTSVRPGDVPAVEPNSVARREMHLLEGESPLGGGSD